VYDGVKELSIPKTFTSVLQLQFLSLLLWQLGFSLWFSLSQQLFAADLLCSQHESSISIDAVMVFLQLQIW
jgi:hypothetical protein